MPKKFEIQGSKLALSNLARKFFTEIELCTLYEKVASLITKIARTKYFFLAYFLADEADAFALEAAAEEDAAAQLTSIMVAKHPNTNKIIQNKLLNFILYNVGKFFKIYEIYSFFFKKKREEFTNLKYLVF